ncbi:uromodulin-like 1 [Neopsephotus bourkii]|uniref:uromodulin-like 1 n=1 Tax=Neopsephotus bourkii TaxID=309878 RepID=UPI002AA546FF|nr:uromodulin-like 1 [Neopsephotus bourkii]
MNGRSSFTTLETKCISLTGNHAHLCRFCHCFLITVFLTRHCRELILWGNKLVLTPFFPAFFFFNSLEKGLSLLGYHLCNYSLTRNVVKMVAYHKSYEKSTSCGGWIPWMVCPKTYYKMQYHTVEVPETVTLTDCCEGYEQVGLYCSLALNRSSVFASRPGACPKENMETSDYPCTFDTECPGLKKCCNSSKGAGCVDPVPEGSTFWYNVTVLVKMDFDELIRVDSHLLNHSRLLHSMITGALEPLSASIHHIQSNHAEVYAGTVASQVLIGLHQPAPLMQVSSSLKDIVKRTYEVIDTEVQDVNECSYVGFNACPEKSTCVNLEGYYSCDPQHEHADVIPHQLSRRKEGIATSTPSSALGPVNTNYSSLPVSNSSLLSITNQPTDAGCYPSTVGNHRVFSVNSSSFEMSWNVTSTLNHTFQVQVFKGKEIVQNLKTEEMKVDVSQLEAGVMYSVEISYETCGKTSISRQNVKTEAKVFGVTMRILNYNFTDDFKNASSLAYEEFSRLLLMELENSFPPNISALYKSGKLKVQVESLQAGSIIARLRITVQDPEFPLDASTLALVFSYLHNGSVLSVDQQNTAVEDWDECASCVENDCSMSAECINLMGSYTCRCKTTMDTNPSRPGRNCEGEIVDPLPETVAPERANSTEFAPEEVSSADPASPATTEMVAATGSETSTAVHLPAALSQGDEQAPRGHSPTSVPPTPWEKGLASQMDFSRDNSPMAAGATASKELAISPSQQSSMAEASPGALQQVAALTNAPMGTAGQGQLSLSLLVFPNQTATTRSHTAFDAPQANSEDGPSTALLAIGDASVPTANTTIKAYAEMGRENSSWSEKHPEALGSPALPGTSPAPSLTPVLAMNRTVQKLSGTVRITNVKYSLSFSNTSSEEYQAFAHLFVDEVHKSLPPEVLQQMDAGLIKVLVTGITNGSTVVSFNLLIAEDVDIYYIIATFHDAFENSSCFTVDKSSLSINDYDECESEEDDCSPDASCHNTFGFYQCSCNEGFDDVHPEKPGRSCEGKKIFNYLMLSTVSLRTPCKLQQNLYFCHSSAFPISPKATAMDEKPVHSTVLPVTSLQTSTQAPSSTSVDLTTEHKGLEDTTFTSVVLPLLTMDPVSTSGVSPQASPVSLIKPAQEVSIKDAVEVFCGIEKIVLAIQKRFLQQESIPETSLYLGEPHCNVSISNGTHVVLQAGWRDCGTEVETNMTNTVVKTILRNAQGVIYHLKVASPIHCVFQNDLLTSSGYTAEGLYTIFEDLHGSGHFRTEMQLFIGNSPIPKNFSISASDDVLIEVGIQRADSKLKVVLTDCWATPTNNSVDPLSFVFISNSCPIPDTYTTLLENGNSSKAQFKMKIFSFVNNSVVYLHCKIRICMERPGSTCRTRCRAVRLMKTGETIATHRTSWGPLCKSAGSDLKRQKEAGVGVGYIILIAFAVFGVVLGVVSLLIFTYQRKMGRYNFRIKSDNFSYQVFYE